MRWKERAICERRVNEVVQEGYVEKEGSGERCRVKEGEKEGGRQVSLKKGG